MENILNKPYEISIWEDFTPTDDKKYYQERKLMIIGSNTMTARLKANKPIFTENVNGTHTLSFTLYSRYFDEEIGDFVDNPFLPYMVNERKVKLYYDNKWYDFVIKNIDENSDDDSFQYTCVDSFINELSKNGFSIELDTKLENNQGTIKELSEAILKGTDWEIGHVDTLVQKNREALYAVKIPAGTTIVGTDMNTLKDEVPATIEITSKPNLTGVEVEQIIYVFYSSAVDSTIPIQFLYREDGKYTFDEEGIVNNSPNYLLTSGTVTIDTSIGAVDNFWGNRIVQKEISKYDILTDHFVTVYEDVKKNEVYMYYENEYISPVLLTNLVSNSINFTNTSGWNAPSPLTIKNTIYPFMYDVTDYPNTTFVPYMRIKYVNNLPVYNSAIISNSSYLPNGIAAGQDFILRIKYGINSDEKGKPLKDSNNKLRAKLAYFKLNENTGVYEFDGNDEIISFIDAYPVVETKNDEYSDLTYVYYKAAARRSVSYAELKNGKIGLFFMLSNADSNNYYFIQEAQFFPYILDSKEEMVLPGSTPNSCVKKKYFYYYPNQIKQLDATVNSIEQQLFYKISNISSATAKELATIFKEELLASGIINNALDALNKAVFEKYGNIGFDAYELYLGSFKSGQDINDMLYSYIGYDKSPDYTLKYDKTFEKIRSITAKESNRFNLIQTLCETFECWPQFEIDHELNGSITIGSNGPQKRINFYEYVGQDNYSGFKYGINLKTIKRSLDSDQIVSKIIVKPNSNQYGIDGYCSIARATENPIKENFLLNFRYYIQQGLLDGNEVNNDLYLYVPGGKYLGYYIQLNKLNKQYDQYITEHSLIEATLSDIDASYKAFKTSYDEAMSLINDNKNIINNYCGVSYEDLIANPTGENKRFFEQEEIQKLITEIQALDAQVKQYAIYYEQKDLEKQQQVARAEEIKTLWEEVLKQKEELNYQFYQKYSKYIQEGSWISEDYMDDNLYYLDAENVLYTSAFPEVSYTIDVLELSQLEDYQNYQFAVGDKTYIEDIEFFGYKSVDGVKTPYQEQVILSEITYNLDDPTENQIKIQNYKTQFEDLFQRITATTQSLQYQVGNFNHAANQFNTDGSITQSSLQNSMINNSLIISNATDQSVTWDETGITITNLSKPNEIVRLVSGGILITNDGGDTWAAGVTGNGINTKYLTAGQIDAERINIISGGFPSFRWDGNGISAYKFNVIDGKPAFFQFNNFVRLDQYGLYGINHDTDFVATSLADVKEFAQFGLTWDGFFLRSDHRSADQSVNGRIEISTQDDFRVIDGKGYERIKIGLLDTIEDSSSETGYRGRFGIRISDKDGAPVMATNDDGMLWLTKKIVIGPDYALDDKYYNCRAQLGVIDTWKANDNGGPLYGKVNDPYSLIFEVKNEFNDETGEGGQPQLSIYDNGRLEARDVYVEGEIVAKTGSIGGLKVEDIGENFSGIEIDAESGITIKEATTGNLSPEVMKFIPKVTGKKEPIYIDWLYSLNGIEYNFYKKTLIGDDADDDGNPIHGNGILEVSSTELYNKFNKDGILYLRGSVDGLGYDNVIITLLKDADLTGVDLDTYQIVPNYPDILKFNNNSNVEEENLIFSPTVLNLKSYKGQEDTAALTKTEIDYDFYLYSQTNNFYNNSNDKWMKLNGQIKEVLYDTTTEKFYETGNLIDSPFNSYISFFNDDTYTINIQDFYTNLRSDNYFGITLKEVLQQENTVFKINLIEVDTKKILASLFCNVLFGTSADMAKLNLLASGLYASVRDAGLVFDSNGLHVINGGFEIKKQVPSTDESGSTIITEEKLFYIENNELYMKGNGTFTGIIHASDGEFTGTINAQDGTLNNLSVVGDISIGDHLHLNGTSTSDKPLVGFYSDNYDPNGDSGFYINDRGDIVANQLSLGAGASIKKYIRLGNTWIINPEWLNQELSKSLEQQDIVVQNNKFSNDSFIVVKDRIYNDTDKIIPSDLINIKQNGSITIGQNEGIKINGNTQSISSFNYLDNKQGWTITPEVAEFNNITARGSLKSVTFEYETNSVQSIGGILLVKPSSAIIAIKKDVAKSDANITYLEITTETNIDLKDNNEDYIKIGESSLGNNLFKASPTDQTNTILLEMKTSLADSINLNDLVGAPLINMGGKTSSSIVINGSNSNTLYPKSALSIFENGITDENPILNPNIKLVLGQMPSIVANKTYGIFNENSYGLYAENVFLKGALISEGQDSNGNLLYSGINTDSKEVFNKDDSDVFNGNTGNIILWAGAPLTDEGNSIDIPGANFKVDHYGNLYAKNGYFAESVITGATITTSKIKTAVLEGTGNPDIAALTIRNADIGIQFEGKQGETIMKLDTNGLALNTELNVGNNFSIRADSSLVVPITLFSKTRSNENITVITPNKIGFSSIVELPHLENEYDNLDYSGFITMNDDGLSIFEKNIATASFNSQEVKLKQNVRVGGSMLSFYDDSGDIVKMKTVINNNGKLIGYDLYID